MTAQRWRSVESFALRFVPGATVPRPARHCVTASAAVEPQATGIPPARRAPSSAAVLGELPRLLAESAASFVRS